jgi:hypothetical protein
MGLYKPDDATEKLLDLGFNSREMTWLWFYLNRNGCDFAPDEFNDANTREQMATRTLWGSRTKEQVDHEINRLLLPEEYLEWITKDARQLKWLTRRIRNGTTWFFSIRTPTALLGREFVVAMIDVWDVDSSEKIKLLSDLARDWNQHKNQDRIFRWFQDEASPQRCKLAWEWLSKNEPKLTCDWRPFDRYSQVLDFFDYTAFSEAEKILRIEAIKKRWSQQQYRERMVGKKQYNFMLSDETISRLDELAETYNLKRPQILDILIQMEAENGIYISEKLKMIRSL